MWGSCPAGIRYRGGDALFVKPLIIVAALAVCVIVMWGFADRIYDSHKATRKNHPFLFKLTGFNEQYIDDRHTWVRHFRIQLILLILLFGAVLLFLVAGRP